MCPSQNYERNSGKHQNANLIIVNPLGTYFKLTDKETSSLRWESVSLKREILHTKNDANKLIEFFFG